MMDYQFNTADLFFALPEMFMVAAIALILLLDLFVSERFQNLTYYLTQSTLAITGYLAFNLIGESAVIFDGTFVLDTIGSYFKVFMMVFSIVALVYSRHYLRAHNLLKAEYFILSLLSVLGMMVMVSAHSMLTIYLGLEIMSLSLYTLIAMARERAVAVEAALKYFVLGAIASGLLLYGMSMIYGITGSLDIGQIAAFATSANLNSDQVLILNFGLVFLVIGVAFKFGAVPFHMWVPDVYQGAPTSVTMFLSTVPKIAATAMLVRLLIDGLGALQAYWADLFMILAILSIGLGSLVALMQTNIKRLLAYSTISHIGFIFGIIIVFNKQGFEADQIVDFRGLSKHSPWFALIMLFVMLSMAGVPPFIGFYSKLFILQQVISAGYVYLAIAAVVFAVISAYYYLQIIKSMYFDDAEKEVTVSAPIDMRIILSINGVLILVLGLMPSYWMELAISLF